MCGKKEHRGSQFGMFLWAPDLGGVRGIGLGVPCHTSFDSYMPKQRVRYESIERKMRARLYSVQLKVFSID